MFRLVCCHAGDRCFKPIYLISYALVVWPVQLVENLVITPIYSYINYLINLHAEALATGLVMGVALAQGLYQGWPSEFVVCLYAIHLAYTVGKVGIGVVVYAFHDVIQFIDIEEECGCLRSTKWRIRVLPHAGYLGILCGLSTALPLLRSLPANVIPAIHNLVSFMLVVVIGIFSGTMRQTVATASTSETKSLMPQNDTELDIHDTME